jgi:hypothetical protein
VLNQRPITATRGISPALAIDQIFKEFLQVLDFALPTFVAAFVKQFFFILPNESFAIRRWGRYICRTVCRALK